MEFCELPRVGTIDVLFVVADLLDLLRCEGRGWVCEPVLKELLEVMHCRN